MERYPRGLRGLTRNQLGVIRRAWVRLPLFPPQNESVTLSFMMKEDNPIFIIIFAVYKQ